MPASIDVCLDQSLLRVFDLSRDKIMMALYMSCVDAREDYYSYCLFHVNNNKCCVITIATACIPGKY